jgi:uncharacterized protein YndB with AHSA1/START domain
MSTHPTIHSTFVHERSYPKPPETVCAAFSDPSKKRRWFGDGDTHDVNEFTIDFRVGGIERVSYTLNDKTPFKGVLLTSEGSYHDIVSNQRIVTAATMSFGGKPISSALVTIELIPTDTGTDLICTHQGAFYEGSDGPEMREGGWRRLFDKLGRELTAGQPVAA